ncbi:arp2/3 complex-activating protein rickA-like isoform X2 [Microplitis mediator]|uniref:arp2/3 complex-activating protein rickA-like isoform X2 n=1 Tax=Microplitis mediator TaxID=375433 RepID=UPI002556E2EE|nr:arp2/3 complex-activating protein rickA-like isoform X2 [Microplitis mediator]
MTSSEYFLTDEKLSPKVIARLKKFELNFDIIEDDPDSGALNYYDKTKADRFQIFDEKFCDKNVTIKNNDIYQHLDVIERQLLTEKDVNIMGPHYLDHSKIDESKQSAVNFFDVENIEFTPGTISGSVKFNEESNNFNKVRTQLNNSLEPVNLIVINSESEFESKITNQLSFQRSTDDSIISKRIIYSLIKFEWLKIPFKKISTLSNWIKFFLKKKCHRIYKFFNSELKIYNENKEELSQVITLSHNKSTENNKMLFLLTEKINGMKEEVIEIRTTSEAMFTFLKSEVQSLKSINKKLSDDNDELIKELKNVSQILEINKFNSKDSSKKPESSCVPPPPPPPPLPLSRTPGVKKTPKNNKTRTPKKCLMPQETRPVITMDDLLKVTLRKAPQEKPKPVDSDPRPVISLEMLKNVKLKSVKNRSHNYKGIYYLQAYQSVEEMTGIKDEI